MFRRSRFWALILFFAMVISRCSPKIHPSGTPSITPIHGISYSENKSAADEAGIEKKSVTRAPKAIFPKEITVNDSAAGKSVDGRLYYDVMGHRYWKNYKDGKYYLFNKSMYSNPDFKKP